MKKEPKEIQEIREQYEKVENDVRKMLQNWIKHNQEQEEVKKVQSSSHNTVDASNDSVHLHSGDGSFNIQNTDEKINEKEKDSEPEEEKQLEITGEAEEVKDPRGQVTIATSVENGYEVRTLSLEEAEKFESHVVLVNWGDVIPEKPTIDDIENILKDANEQFQESIEKNHDFLVTEPSIWDAVNSDVVDEEKVELDKEESPSISDFISKDDNEPIVDIEDDSPSIKDFTEEIEEAIDKVPSISDFAVSDSDVDEAVIDSSNDETVEDVSIPSIADMVENEAEKSDSVEDLEYEIAEPSFDDLRKKALFYTDESHESLEWIAGMGNKELLDHIKDGISNKISSLEKDLEYYPEDRQIQEELGNLLDERSELDEFSENNRDELVIRDDGVIFIGADYDIINEPEIIEYISLKTLGEVLKEQVAEFMKNEAERRQSIPQEELLQLPEQTGSEATQGQEEDSVVLLPR